MTRAAQGATPTLQTPGAKAATAVTAPTPLHPAAPAPVAEPAGTLGLAARAGKTSSAMAAAAETAGPAARAATAPPEPAATAGPAARAVTAATAAATPPKGGASVDWAAPAGRQQGRRRHPARSHGIWRQWRRRRPRRLDGPRWQRRCWWRGRRRWRSNHLTTLAEQGRHRSGTGPPISAAWAARSPSRRPVRRTPPPDSCSTAETAAAA